MPEKRLYEAVANLVLRSISVWEDMHLYALTYSIEYHTFWGLLDDNMKSAIFKYSKRNREERLVPFTMGLARYYNNVLTPENFARIKDQHWKKQLKIILSDVRFRELMTNLNLKLNKSRNSDYVERRAADNDSVMRPVYN